MNKNINGKNNFQFLFFNILLVIGGASLTVSNTIMRTYPKNGYLIYIIILPLILLAIYLTKIERKSLKKILNSFNSRMLLLTYMVSSSFIYIIAYLKVTNDFFYQLTSPFIIIIIILLASVFFSTYGIKNIINVGFILFFLATIISSLTIINSTKYDLHLLGDFSIEINQFLPLIGYLFVYFDSLILPFFLNTKTRVKKNYLIISIIAVILNSLFIFQNYLFFDSNYFIEGRYPYILRYLTFANNRYFEHFDIIYLIFITIYIFIRLSINIEIFRITLKIKRNNYLVFIFPIILVILSYLISMISFGIDMINLLMIISTVLVFLFLLYHQLLLRRKKE